MPSTIGPSSLYSFDSLANSAPPSAGAGQRRAQLGMSAQELVEAQFEHSVHRSQLIRLEPAGERVERHLALLAAVEIAQRRRAARQLVVAEHDRGAGADPVGPPHAALRYCRE